jgi:DNA-binding CsgD family transcriptional regulator
MLADDYRAAGAYRSVDELIEIIDGNAIPALFQHLQKQATAEVLIVTTPPYAVGIAHNATEFEQLSRGVAYRSLYTHEALELPDGLDDLQRFVQAGEQARVVPGSVRKLAVFDRRVAMLPVGREPARPRSTPVGVSPLRPTNPDASDCLLIHESAMLDALIELFERLWLTAVPVDAPQTDASQPADPGELSITPAESRLLAMLVVGMTDDAIGRQLGLARRTVVRRVHQLMHRAKAGNRLQLVLRAAQLGWIDIDRDTAIALPQRRAAATLER